MKEKLNNEKERKIKQKSHIALHTSQNSGITLVALIITIIVLLILAVVAIRAVQEDGIITKAKEAKSATTIEQEKEQIQLAVNEWQIQKNYQNEPGSFKTFMISKLKDTGIATSIDGDDNGPLTVTMKDTDNIYTVKEDGTITGPKEIGNLSDLERYILGENGDGRSFGEIIGGEGGFIDDPNTIPDASTTVIMLGSANKDSNTAIAYIKYQGEKYKFAVDMSIGNTYGLVKLEKPAEDSKVGKYVNYDGKTWIILYDDATNGLQMISAESLQYNGAEFYLGYEDSLINWDSLTDEEKNKVNLDGDEEKNLTNFEKSVYSYNNAITTLNTACENLVAESSNITSVRCAGSNPTNKNSENTTKYTSDNLSIWPKDNSDYAVGIGNGIGNSTDNNYESDYDRMVVLGIQKCNIENKSYWLASRFVDEYSSRVGFDIRYVYDDGVCNSNSLWSVHDSNADGSRSSELLRPVVTLKSDISFSGSGTADDPYTF